MSFPVQCIAKFSVLTLCSVLLVACGGSDAPSAPAKDAAKDAAQKAQSAITEASDMVDKAAGSAQEVMGQARDAMADAAESAAAAGKTVAAAEPDLAAGEATYGRFCFSCHAAGVAGAPKLGDAQAWAPRIAKGLDMLVASSIEGIPPGMPAKGLCMSCSEEDMRNTVAWMIAQ